MGAHDVAERTPADRAAAEAWLTAVANRAGVDDPRTASLDQLHGLILAARNEPRGPLSAEQHHRLYEIVGEIALRAMEAKRRRDWGQNLETAAKLAKDGAKVAGKKPEQFPGLVAFIGSARRIAAANRRAADAIERKKDPSVEVRESRRTTRRALNRARRGLGLHPLPVPRPLRSLACQGARHRRAPGRKLIRRPGSRRTPAPTRGDPDDGDPEPPAPAPGAERRDTGGRPDLAAHRRRPRGWRRGAES